MPLTTPISRLPYAVLSDPANIETAVKPLAEALDARMTPGAAELATVRSLGAEARQAARGNDVRLSDERIPIGESVSVGKTGRGSLGLAQGAFAAVRPTAQTIAKGGGVLICDAKEFDVSGWYDTLTGRFTPQVAGVYRFSAFVGLGLSSTATGEVLVRMNASPKYRIAMLGGLGTTNVAITAGGSCLMKMNGSTDYADVFAQHNEASAVLTLPASSYFCGELVGKT